MMTIEITSPDLEMLIQQRMKAGAFRNPEELIRAALASPEPDTRTGADLIAALRECPYPDVEIEPSRIPSPLVRDIVL